MDTYNFSTDEYSADFEYNYPFYSKPVSNKKPTVEKPVVEKMTNPPNEQKNQQEFNLINQLFTTIEVPQIIILFMFLVVVFMCLIVCQMYNITYSINKLKKLIKTK